MLEIEESKSALIAYIKSAFSFLVEGFGFVEALDHKKHDYADGVEYYFLRYTSEEQERQLEIVLQKNSSLILCILKRIKHSSTPDYYDKSNTVEIKDLELFISPNEFDYKKHILYTEESKTQYFSRIADKFQGAWKNFLVGDQWIDRNEIDTLYPKKGFKGKSGFEKDKFLSRIERTIKHLEALPYEIIENSNDSDPFSSLPTKHLTIHNADKEVYLKFEISYKNQTLFFKKRKSVHQDYRLLNFHEINSNSAASEIEKIVSQWLEEELGNDSI